MKLIMYTHPQEPLPVHDREGRLIGLRVLERQRIVFEADEQERGLLKPGMVLRVQEARVTGEIEFVVLNPV